MAVLPLVTGADKAILRTVCQPVEVFDEQLKKLIADMTETMTHPDQEGGVTGIGLAAPQVGVDARVLLTTLNMESKNSRTLCMVNPVILETSKHTVVMDEGCLSLPGTFGKVRRPSKVHVQWQNADGHSCERKFSGWDARIFLHEYDHLEGILFTDYNQ